MIEDLRQNRKISSLVGYYVICTPDEQVVTIAFGDTDEKNVVVFSTREKAEKGLVDVVLSTSPDSMRLAMYTACKENPFAPDVWGALADYIDETVPDFDDREGLAIWRAAAALLQQEQAKFWIDNRQRACVDLLSWIAHEPERLAREAAKRKEKEEKEKAEQEAIAAEKKRLWDLSDAVARKFHDFFDANQPVYWVLSYESPGCSRPIVTRFDSQAAAEAGAIERECQPGHFKIIEKHPPLLVSEVQVWNRNDKRVYFGHGYSNNCGTYYHDGTERKRPGTLKLNKAAAARLGDREEEFKAYLVELCAAWKSLTVKITPEGTAANE